MARSQRQRKQPTDRYSPNRMQAGRDSSAHRCRAIGGNAAVQAKCFWSFGGWEEECWSWCSWGAAVRPSHLWQWYEEQLIREIQFDQARLEEESESTRAEVGEIPSATPRNGSAFGFIQQTPRAAIMSRGQRVWCMKVRLDRGRNPLLTPGGQQEGHRTEYNSPATSVVGWPLLGTSRPARRLPGCGRGPHQ